MTVFAFFVGTFALTLVSAKESSRTKQSGLKTDFNFDGKVVGGKRQNTPESITTVEDDKSLDDLIGVRKNFSDRITRSKELR